LLQRVKIAVVNGGQCLQLSCRLGQATLFL
jgi:hypothetical protein